MISVPAKESDLGADDLKNAAGRKLSPAESAGDDIQAGDRSDDVASVLEETSAHAMPDAPETIPELPDCLYDYSAPTDDEGLSPEPGKGDAIAGVAKAAKGKKKHKKKKKPKVRLAIAHQAPGRVRLKVAAGKNDPDMLKQVAETFSAIPGMERITVKAVTGSIILNYDEDNQKAFNERLMKRLTAQGGAPMIGSEFDELAKKIENQAAFFAERSQTARIIVDFFKRVDRELKKATNNLIDLKIVLAVGVAALTIFEVGTNSAAPIWLILSIFAVNHFIELRGPADLEPAPVKAPVVFR